MSRRSHNLPRGSFRCIMTDCRSRPFTTKANLNRHVKSKHGRRAMMPCGKFLGNYSCNLQRHKASCLMCCVLIAGGESHFTLPPVPPGTGPVPVPPGDPRYIDPHDLSDGITVGMPLGRQFRVDERLIDGISTVPQEPWAASPGEGTPESSDSSRSGS